MAVDKDRRQLRDIHFMNASPSNRHGTSMYSKEGKRKEGDGVKRRIILVEGRKILKPATGVRVCSRWPRERGPSFGNDSEKIWDGDSPFIFISTTHLKQKFGSVYLPGGT